VSQGPQERPRRPERQMARPYTHPTPWARIGFHCVTPITAVGEGGASEVNSLTPADVGWDGLNGRILPGVRLKRPFSGGCTPCN
jgi:hypothetical protein